MPNLMDNAPFMNQMENRHNSQVPNNFVDAFRMAQQNPTGFEEQIKRNNPQAYQMACHLRNTSDPRSAVLQMMQSRGMNPNILNMLGFK